MTIKKTMETDFGVNAASFEAAGFSIDTANKVANISVLGFAENATKPLLELNYSVSNYIANEEKETTEEITNPLTGEVTTARHKSIGPVEHNDYDAFEPMLASQDWKTACQEYLLTLPEFAGAAIS